MEEWKNGKYFRIVESFPIIPVFHHSNLPGQFAIRNSKFEMEQICNLKLG